jgi:hypothetical protein
MNPCQGHAAESAKDEWVAEFERLLTQYDNACIAVIDLSAEETRAALVAHVQTMRAAPQPVGEVPMPPKCHPLHKLGQRLAELLDENQWAECERLLLEGWKHEQKPVSTADVPMPEPIGRLYFGGVSCGERDEWEFDADQVVCDRINESATEESRQRVYLHRDVRTYGVQCRAAGYAAGVAAERSAALRGEVQP